MADKNKPYHGDREDGKFDQDDPFAELARLIAPREEEQPRAPETADDLADELLREFNTFPDQYPVAEDPQPEPPAPEPEVMRDPQRQPRVYESFHLMDYPAYETREQTGEPDYPERENAEPFVGQEPELDPSFLEEELRQSISSLEFSEKENQQPVHDETNHPDALFSAAAFDDETPDAQPEGTGHRSAPADEQWQPSYTFSAPSFQDDDPVEPHEQDLALDMDELEQELAEVSLPVEDKPEPLEKAGASEAGRDDVFDPSAIVSTEEMPRPVDELDLPNMEDETESRREPASTAYEYDLDEELADVLATQPALVDPLQETPAALDPPEEPVHHPSSERAYEADIERALEDDFQFAAGPQPADPRGTYDNLGEEDYYNNDEAERRPSWLAVTFMGYGRVIALGIGFVVLAVLAVFAGLRYVGGESDTGPVIIAADDTSVKEAPEDPGGEVVPNQDNVIFNDAAETLEATPRQGSLIASDQQPVDVDDIAPNPLANSAASDSAGQAGNGIVEPRRVRTIIVRPDGTLVERSEPESSTGNTATSTANTNAPDTSTSDSVGSSVPVASADGTTAVNAGDQAGSEPAVSDATSVADVLNGATEEAGDTATDAVESDEPDVSEAPVEDFGIANAPLPTPRSSTGGPPARAVSSAPTQAVVSAAPAATSAAAPSSRYAMQIASLPSEAEARQAYRRLAAQYPAILGRRSMEIVSADVTGKGTYYRVRIPAQNLSAALSLCESYKAAGGSCYVPR